MPTLGLPVVAGSVWASCRQPFLFPPVFGETARIGCLVWDSRTRRTSAAAFGSTGFCSVAGAACGALCAVGCGGACSAGFSSAIGRSSFRFSVVGDGPSVVVVLDHGYNGLCFGVHDRRRGRRRWWIVHGSLGHTRAIAGFRHYRLTSAEKVLFFPNYDSTKGRLAHGRSVGAKFEDRPISAESYEIEKNWRGRQLLSWSVVALAFDFVVLRIHPVDQCQQALVLRRLRRYACVPVKPHRTK